ncbi:MAG: 3-deoxy-7-phosphoheptulonate synthase class II [Myxococcota bacterium]|nr:3-deoxy-7-phosphoheptulonate synthase class II [Myxococcota bacterium]
MTWSPDSWHGKPIRQQPSYRDANAVAAALARVRELPPLVAHGEVDALRTRLARASRGEAFLLQGGDCAERFADCSKEPIEAKLKILLQMSLVLTWGARIPVVRVARIGGQYAKPRSKDTEVIDGVELPSFRGEHVNGIEPTLEAREPDPNRLIDTYFHSSATLNYARALLDGGFADLHNPQHWDLGYVRSDKNREAYETIRESILDALDFVESTGVSGQGAFRTVELFASHEGLLLPYEEAHTIQINGRWYNLGAHMLWIGDRTRQLDGAHVEYFRGIENPMGVKVGPTMQPSELVELLETLEPKNRAGRITLITRMGADKVADGLPVLIDAVERAGRQVVWSCDPMHGNTESTSSGVKTRNFDNISRELEETFRVHDEMKTILGGVHFELTGQDVTECVGGPQELSESDLSRSYETYCDPRLNYAQSMEMAFLMAQRLQMRRQNR